MRLFPHDVAESRRSAEDRWPAEPEARTIWLSDVEGVPAPALELHRPAWGPRPLVTLDVCLVCIRMGRGHKPCTLSESSCEDRAAE